MNTDNWITAVLALRKAKRVVAFTGAGISAESGVPTFRDAEGFWRRFPPEKFATWKGLLSTAATDPRAVAEFVLNVVEPIAVAEPNPGHQALAELEQRVPTTVVTQNIDGLHQTAGSTMVLEVHGSLAEIVHASTGDVVHRLDREEMQRIAGILRDYSEKRTGLLSFARQLRKVHRFDWLGRHRPNLVLFGDAMAEPAWTNASKAAENCDLFLSVGTSGAVYPAAMLPTLATNAGARVVTVDPHVSGPCWLQGTAGSVLPKLMDAAFEGE
jgi:NAD-dependent deacetylase